MYVAESETIDNLELWAVPARIEMWLLCTLHGSEAVDRMPPSNGVEAMGDAGEQLQVVVVLFRAEHVGPHVGR
jgi:hypothetical protein